jgi:hypothetical protein
MANILPLVNVAFGEMRLIFGRKYTSRFSSKGEIDATKRMWAIGFKLQRINAAQVSCAIKEIIARHLEWPPELPEFLELCDQPSALGIPTFDDTLQTIVDRHGKHRTNSNYKFASDFIAVINMRCGKHCLTEAAKSFEKRLQKHYKKAVFEHKTGTLPAILPALPAPDLPPTCAGYTADPNSPLMKRMAALKSASRSKA